jgi:hypothetical protein
MYFVIFVFLARCAEDYDELLHVPFFVLIVWQEWVIQFSP